MKNKKYWLAGLFSVAVLGSAIAYGTFSQPPKKDAKIEQKQSEKKTDKSWILPKTKNDKESEKKETKDQKADTILGLILGDVPKEKEDSGFFSAELSPKNLLGQLASAIGLQDDKEKSRENVAEAAEKDKPTSDKPLPAPTIPIPELPAPIEPLPDPTPVIPDPQPQPAPEPIRPTLDEQVNQARGNLNLANVKVQFLTLKLNNIQKDLDKLETVKSETNVNSLKASMQWTKVKSLVDEYNQLSADLKKLIAEDGSIAKENETLYNETYARLSNKVTELKDAQQKANATTNSMNNTVKEADDVLNSLDSRHQEYQKAQQQVADNQAQAQIAVSTAQENSDVGTAVQQEIDATNQAVETMNNANQSTKQQLEAASSEETKATVDSAKQKTETVNDLATQQNQAANDAINDFNSLPIPIKQEPSKDHEQVPSETTQTPAELSSTTVAE